MMHGQNRIKPAACMLYRGDESGRYLRNVGLCVQIFTASHSRRL